MLDKSLKNANILIVDDQESNIDLLVGLLEKKGYGNLKSTTDARQVVALFNEFQPDLILLDLMMPHLDGFQVMEQLKPLIPPDTYLPILVLTADITPDAKQRALANGARDFLTKPLDMTEVALRIKNLLEARYLHLQLQNQNQILDERVRQRTAQLASSEVRYRALVDTSPDGITLTDLEGILILCNQQMARLHGYENPEAMHGINVFELISPEERLLAAQNAQKTLKDGSVTNIEYTLLRKDGSRFPAELSAALIRDAEGAPAAFIGITRDITDRKRADEVLREAETMYRNIIERLPGIAYIAEHGEAGVWHYVGPQIERMLGYTQEEWLADPSLWFQRLSPDDRERLFADDAKDWERGSSQPKASEYRLIARDGRTIWVRDDASILLDDSGRPKLWQGVLYDITERKQAEAQIERQLHRLAGLRTIDTAITGSLDLRLTLNVVLEQTTAQLGMDAASVLLLNSHTQTLTYAAGRGFRTNALQHTRLRLGEGYAGRAALERQLIHIPDLRGRKTDFL
ncbi:MAG: hypothetical protein C0393_07465, partial [Anaerolinea sp.]|nr:hypothetical protein [Anaerolinea sp.]